MNAIEHAWEFLIEARKIPSFATSDERLRDGTWMIALIGGVHRDSTALDAANAAEIRERLDAVDPDGAAHDWIRCSHWGVGWVQHLIVDPTNEAVLRTVGEIGCALADYPILNESRYSEMETEWHSEGKCGEDCSFDHCESCGIALHDHARGDRCMSC
jgi:hypothetical protein